MSMFDVQLVTPQGLITETSAASVNAPGVLGEFEVLPGHIPFLTELHPGVVKVGKDSDKRVFAVTKGFLEVEPNTHVKILVEQAVPADKINVEETNRELAEVEASLKAWTGELSGEYQTLRDREAWAHARLAARAA